MRRAVQRLLAYSRLAHEIEVRGRLSADIHLVHSEDEDNRDWVGFMVGNTWEAFTSGRHYDHQGSGLHMDMLLGEHLARNAKLIAAILHGEYEEHDE